MALQRNKGRCAKQGGRAGKTRAISPIYFVVKDGVEFFFKGRPVALHRSSAALLNISSLKFLTKISTVS